MFFPVFYICLIGFLPLVYTFVRSLDRVNIRDKKFMALSLKDFIRTLPICALVLLPIVVFPCITKWYLLFIHIVFVPVLFLELGHIYLFKTRIGLNTFFTLFVSNVRETKEFIKQNISYKWFIVAFLVMLLPIPLILMQKPPVFTRLEQILLIFILAAFSYVFIRNLFKKWPKFKDGYVLNPYSNAIYHYFEYRKNYQSLKKAIEDSKPPVYDKITSKINQKEPETYVVVIGESASRLHHSYYGYPRDTNEFLKKSGEEIFVFKNVSSPYAQTIPVMEKVLTFATKEHPELLLQKGSVISYLNQAGFKTYFLSNQYALVDTIVTAISSSHATYSKYYNFSGMKRFEKAGLDESLLPDFEKILNNKDKKKVIFLHLMGSHAAYINRYPTSFSRFTDPMKGKKLTAKGHHALNTYDNSIRYTDYILAEIIALLKKKAGANYMLYFSDHGEDVYDSTDKKILGHSEIATHEMTAIPFMVWLSDRLKKLRPDLVKKMKASADVKYNTENVIHSIIEFSSLENSDFDSSKSILNKKC
ncbi:MAG: phosphoethanolamine transferase [Lactobacillales bacterium]|nr:phosphoethanolamine transferase [Lactobacillales bacterium]